MIFSEHDPKAQALSGQLCSPSKTKSFNPCCRTYLSKKKKKKDTNKNQNTVMFLNILTDMSEQTV